MYSDKPGLLLFFYLRNIWSFAILQATEVWYLEGLEKGLFDKFFEETQKLHPQRG